MTNIFSFNLYCKAQNKDSENYMHATDDALGKLQVIIKLQILNPSFPFWQKTRTLAFSFLKDWGWWPTECTYINTRNVSVGVSKLLLF